MDARLRKFVDLFNEKAFFDAHEVLEELWLEIEGESRDFYKGLIQCAVAFVHLERKNFRGAYKLHSTAIQYLARYDDEYEGIPNRELLDDFNRFFDEVVPSLVENPDFEMSGLETPQIRISV